MAKKFAKLFEEVIKRAKISVDEKKSLKAVVDSLPDLDVDDDDYDSVLGNLHNLDTAEAALTTKLVERGRAEAYNSTESQVHELADSRKSEGLLTDVQLAEIKGKKRVADKIKIMGDFMKDNLKADIKDAKKDGDKDLEARLKENLATLNTEMKTLRETHQTETATLTAKHKTELLNRDLKFKLFGRSDIPTESLKDRHFARNFMADFDEYVAKNGIVINADTLELQRADGTPFYTKTQDLLDLDGLMGTVVKEFGYEKKSDPIDKTVVSVEDDKELSAAQAKNLSRINRG